MLIKQIYIMVGISGAGKTTWIKNKTSETNLKFVNISPDIERKRITGDISNQECSAKAFSNCFNQLRIAVMDDSVNLIFWDATNLSVKYLNDILRIIKDSNINWTVKVACLEDSRDWELCYNRVETDLKNGADRSRTINCFNDVSGLPLIQDMSNRYVQLVDKVIDDWCKRNNVERVNIYGEA